MTSNHLFCIVNGNEIYAHKNNNLNFFNIAVDKVKQNGMECCEVAKVKLQATAIPGREKTFVP